MTNADYFSSFWSIYPRKIARPATERAAKKIQPDEWPAVMEGTKKYISYWKKLNTEKQYIPHPATFINNRRWEDEIETIEEQAEESNAYTFTKAVLNKNNRTLPDLPHDIKQVFFKIGLPWTKLQGMSEIDLQTAYMNATKEPKPVVEFARRAAGDME